MTRKFCYRAELKFMLYIDSKTEKNKISKFIKKTLQKQGFGKVVLGLSGGIDSTTNLYLLKEALPVENIFVLHLPYFDSSFIRIKQIVKDVKISEKNFFIFPIKKPVDEMIKLLKIDQKDRIRIGNVMVRTRMIALYDFAKKYQALVCGTENKSEHLLGYFTRFGDEASDFEPIRHLYKTQVYKLAGYLKVPKGIIKLKPTAGLWQNQTDEDEFGFSYKEADKVLYWYFDQKLSIEKIKAKGFQNAEKIINFALKNQFKHQTPYSL